MGNAAQLFSQTLSRTRDRTEHKLIFGEPCIFLAMPSSQFIENFLCGARLALHCPPPHREGEKKKKKKKRRVFFFPLVLLAEERERERRGKEKRKNK